MLGAIAGDIIGSVYEFAPIKSTEFPLFSLSSTFTDDTVLTVAIADALIYEKDICSTLKEYTKNFPDRGYGRSFFTWAMSDSKAPYNSWGNGSAMRTSPIGFFFKEEKQILEYANRFASVTHNHLHGISGAQAVSLAIFLARNGSGKKEIRRTITSKFDYDLSKSLSDIRPSYQFDVSCQGSIPQAILAFLESSDVENAIRLAISLGGDADTMAAIAGAIAEAFYGGVPDHIAKQTRQRLPKAFLSVIDDFYTRI